MLRQDSPKKFWAHTKSSATSVRRSMGPLWATQMLRQDSPKKFWAHTKSSATSMERSMGPLRGFGRTHRRNSGPIWNHRPLLWGDQWAHPDASARLTKVILGPYKIIGHFYGEINGPTSAIRQKTFYLLGAFKCFLAGQKARKTAQGIKYHQQKCQTHIWPCMPYIDSHFHTWSLLYRYKSHIVVQELV